MNYPKDPKLAELGKKLTSSVFRTPLSEHSKTRTAVIEAAEAEGKLRGVKHAPGDREPIFLIQSYVGGSIRSFGSVRLDVFHACRLADMLTLKFGHLRLMYCRPSTAEDFNYSSEQAAADFINEPAIAAIVLDIFSHLRSIDALLDPDNLPSTPQPPSRKNTAARIQKEKTQLDRIEATLQTIIEKLG